MHTQKYNVKHNVELALVYWQKLMMLPSLPAWICKTLVRSTKQQFYSLVKQFDENFPHTFDMPFIDFTIMFMETNGKMIEERWLWKNLGALRLRSYDGFLASSKAISTQPAIQCFRFQFPISSYFLRCIQ